MKNYKVLVEFELDGTAQAVDSVIELSEEVAAPLVEEGKIAEEISSSEDDSSAE